MKRASRIKPISYAQDVASYEATQETLALLKIIALGNRQIEEGRALPLAEVKRRIRARRVGQALLAR